MTWLLGLRSLLKSVPWPVWAALALSVAWLIDRNAQYNAGYEQRAAEQAETERKALEKAREADSASRDAVRQFNSELERQNDEAEKAAAGSDDPLRAGLDSLREQQTRPDTTPR